MKKTEFIDGFADLHDDEEILRIDGFDEACIGWTDSLFHGLEMSDQFD